MSRIRLANTIYLKFIYENTNLPMCTSPNSNHVFELADAGRGESGKELSHRIEKALHIYGEQHAAQAGDRCHPFE